MTIEVLEQRLEGLSKKSEEYGRWEDTLAKKLGSGMLATKIFTLINRSPINWDNVFVANLINKSTLGDTTSEDMKVVVDSALNSRTIKAYNKDENFTEITMNDDSKLRFMLLTDFWPSLAENRPELLTMDRGGHCHINCYRISQFFDMEHNVVSGWCSSYSNTKKFSHSWIEFEGKKDNWVIDYNINAVVSKDAYYKLYNPTDMVRIGKNQLREDSKLIENSGFNNRDIRMYLFWPDDVRDVAKAEIAENEASDKNCM